MKLGILTGGGDCPGLNPVIRAAVKTALKEGFQVFGIHNGWKGFLYPFLLPKDYTDRTVAIDHFLKSGSPKEVYELAGLTAEGIKNKILKAI